MTAELRRSLVLAGAGLLAGFALVLVLFGAGDLAKRLAGPGTPAPVASLPDTPGPPSAGEPSRREEADVAQPGKPAPAGEQIPAPSAPGATTPVPPAAASAAPTFDIIRIEPNGDSVIAGRGAPNTTVELLRDGDPIARVLIDPSGQFAIVPPALPPGNSEITLRITGADGQVRRSKESVAVVVSRNRDAKPLIALSAPDRPTVVLSQPEPVATGKETGKEAVSPAGPAAKPPATAAAPAGTKEVQAPKEPVKIVGVDAEEGGRLYVTGKAAPGATVRLYLNDTLVAPGSAGADGRLAFAIGRGVTPGDYRVRIDEVDAVSGKVKARSEVSFAVPAPTAAASPRPALAPPRPAADPDSERRPLAAAPAEPTAADTPPTPERRAAMARTDMPAAATAPPRSEAAKPAPSPSEPAAPVPGLAERPGAPERTVFIPEIGTAKIARGDNLWQISRRVYGKGTRYTVIFDANQSQIRNPDLIYPGQIFVLPTGGAAAERTDGKRG